MTDEAFRTAIEAKASADAAHHRLDRMNGSIDRLGNEIVAAKSEINTKLDGVLLHLAHSTGYEQGEQKAKDGFLDNRRHVVLVLATLAGAVAVLLGVVLAHYLG